MASRAPAVQILPSSTRWSIPVSAASTIAPIIVGDRIVAVLPPDHVGAFRLSDGGEVWRVALRPTHPLSAGNGRVYVAAGEAVHAIRVEDGGAAWRWPSGPVTAPPLVHEGWVIVSSADRIGALRETDGSIVWQRASGGHAGRATIGGNVLYVPYSDGQVAAFDLATGTPKWETKLGGAPSEILAVDDRLYVGADNKLFYCLDADRGEILWPRRAGAAVRGRPAADAEHVYFTGFDNVLRALDRRNGAERWQAPLSFRPWAGPILVGSAVLVPGPSATLATFAAKDGRPYRPIAFGAPLLAPPAFVDTERGPVVAAITGGLTEDWRLSVLEQATTIAVMPLTVLPGQRRMLPAPPPRPSIPTIPLTVLPGVPVPLPVIRAD